MSPTPGSRKTKNAPGRMVDLPGFLRDLVKSAQITQADCSLLLDKRHNTGDFKKPLLAWIADQNLVDQLLPNRALDIETLARFLAEQSGQEYYLIDPLKINVAKVTQVMSYAFTQRPNILAMEVGPQEVVIASDVHLEPRREKWNIRFRIDGALYTVYALPMQVMIAVTSRLKILARMNVAEKRRPLDGRLKTKSPNGMAIQSALTGLCPHCKTRSAITDEEWKVLTSAWTVRKPKIVASSVGCLECRQTGYKGRQGLYEVMPMTETLQRCIDDKTDLQKLRQEAFKEGMRSLRLSGVQKVTAGTTTVSEVLRVTSEKM